MICDVTLPVYLYSAKLNLKLTPYPDVVAISLNDLMTECTASSEMNSRFLAMYSKQSIFSLTPTSEWIIRSLSYAWESIYA